MAKPGGFVKGHRRQSSASFEELVHRDAVEGVKKELFKLLQTAPEDSKTIVQQEFDGFEQLFKRFVSPSTPREISWEKIKLVTEDVVKPYRELADVDPANVKRILDKLVVVKLNGGLGTSMGCTGPKSLICVRDNLTFLDLVIQQIELLNKSYQSNIPLVLMDSFNTEEESQKMLRKYGQVKVEIKTFLQSRYPRINRETLLPIATNIRDSSEHEAWYPPGHGDVYASFYNSGLLQEFIKQGKEYVFISNIDNLGATVDLNILNFLINHENGQKCEFVMEVTDKTRADVKGGTLVEYEDKLRLLEIAQVPKQHVDEFKSITKFKIFNTNNLWISLRAIERVIEEDKLNLEIIVNPKTLDSGVNVVQLETAVGAGIKCFNNPLGINVSRKRFLPVKTSSDLLIIMSNLYSLSKGALVMNPKRLFPSIPLCKLGPDFQRVKDFLRRFASIPDVLELDHLTVSGDVTFGRGVTLKGTVIIIANHGDRIDIPAGAILENKIVSGNLRILDH